LRKNDALTLQVPMSGMPDMMPASLAMAVAPRKGKIIKKWFLEDEKICYKMVYHTLYLR